MENNTFKSVAFGGFDKLDVIRYIEQTSREAAAVQEKLQQENDGLRAEVQALTLEGETMRTQLEDALAKAVSLQEQLERETEARRALEPLKEEAERLRAQVAALQPDAETYAQFRDRVGEIECEAHKRAAALEAATIARLESVLNTFRAQYTSLMSTFDTTATHVTGELRKIEVNLAQLPRAMDQSGVDLGELAATLDRAKERE